MEAVAVCDSAPGLNISSSAGSMLSASELLVHLASIAAADATLEQRLSSLLSAASSPSPSGSSSSPPLVPDGWQLWGWDPRRGCRALRRSSEHRTGDWQGSWTIASDVPCSWQLAFVCTEAADGGGDGGQGMSSSAWYRRWLEAAASQPSPYRLGPGASGLQLVSSGALLTPPCHPCMPCAPGQPNRTVTRCFDEYGTDLYDRPVVSFNDSELFWQYGPITSMLMRSADFPWLRPFREADPVDPWALYRSWSAFQFPPNKFVEDHLQGGLTWEYYNTGAAYDYIVTVQACFGYEMLQGITLVTRSGRQYRYGSSRCIYWFREDAPPGGYLAGFAGSYRDSYPGLYLNFARYSLLLQQQGTEMYTESSPAVNYILELQLLWAAPDGSGPPTSIVHTPDQRGVPPPCPLARPLASTDSQTYNPQCGPVTGLVCASDTCCGRNELFSPVGAPAVFLRQCGNARLHCQSCSVGYGLCGTQPDSRRLLLLADASDPRPPPAPTPGPGSRPLPFGAAAGGLLFHDPAVRLPYTEALSYCSASSYMGLAWSLAAVEDVLAMEVSRELREATVAMLAGGVWVKADPVAAAAQPAGNSSCIVAVYGVQVSTTKYIFPHAFYNLTCYAPSIFLCKATVDHDRSSVVTATTTGGRVEVRSRPGLHLLTLSSPLGDGPYGPTSCPFTLGWAAPHPGASDVAAGSELGAEQSPSPGWLPDGLNNTAVVLNETMLLSSIGIASAHFAVNRSITQVMVMELPSGLKLGRISIDVRNITGDAGGSTDSGTPQDWQQSEHVAGAASSAYSWQALSLSPGEAVVAVSGCHGGFLERLVLHTATGRLWAPQPSTNALCTIPFVEMAPPGGYLVGAQGYLGSTGFEQVQLVWAQPVGGTDNSTNTPGLGQSRPPLIVAPDGNEPSGHSSGGGTPIGPIAGGAAGGIVVLLAVWAWGALALRRRRRGQADVEGSASHKEAPVESEGELGSLSSPASGEPSAAGRGLGPVTPAAPDSNTRSPPSGSGDGLLAAWEAALPPQPPAPLDTQPLEEEVRSYLRSRARPIHWQGQESGDASASPEGNRGAAEGQHAQHFQRAGNTGSLLATGDGEANTVQGAGAQLPARQPMSPFAPDGGNASGGSVEVQQGASAGAAAGGGAAVAASADGEQALEALRRQVAEAAMQLQGASTAGGSPGPGGSAAPPPPLRLLEQLGRGSYGVVHLAMWRGLRVAVKTVVVGAGTQPPQRHRSLLEAAICTSLHHPHVVTTYGYHTQQLAVVGAPAAGAHKHSAAAPTTPPHDGGAGPAAQHSLDLADDPGHVYKLYIIQEYCDAGSMADAMKSGWLGCGKDAASNPAALLCALTLALDVARGLCHIHSKNIVHGDLSAGNVLLASRESPAGPGTDPAVAAGGPAPVPQGPQELATGPQLQQQDHDGASSEDALVSSALAGCWRPPVVAKVADFGLSVALGEDQTHASRRFQGTPAYTAPEVLAMGRLGKAADMWAFGVLLLEVTSGRPAACFRELHQQGAGLAAGATPPPGRHALQHHLLTAAPAPVAPLAAACLALDPAARPTSGEVVRALVGVLLRLHGLHRQWAAGERAPVG